MLAVGSRAAYEASRPGRTGLEINGQLGIWSEHLSAGWKGEGHTAQFEAGAGIGAREEDPTGRARGLGADGAGVVSATSARDSVMPDPKSRSRAGASGVGREPIESMRTRGDRGTDRGGSAARAPLERVVEVREVRPRNRLHSSVQDVLERALVPTQRGGLIESRAQYTYLTHVSRSMPIRDGPLALRRRQPSP